MSDTRRWWHLYGGEAPDMSEDEDGGLGPAWGTILLGGSTKPPEVVAAENPFLTPSWAAEPIPYLASFDHEPSDEEQDALAPEQYRDEYPEGGR